MVKYMVTVKRNGRSKTWYEKFDNDEQAKEEWYEARQKERGGASLVFTKIDPVTFREMDIIIGP